MKKFYPLSHTQKVIWDVEKFAPNTSINNVAGTLRFKQTVNLTLMEEAINILIKKR